MESYDEFYRRTIISLRVEVFVFYVYSNLAHLCPGPGLELAKPTKQLIERFGQNL